jgi:hypothetical protein
MWTNLGCPRAGVLLVLGLLCVGEMGCDEPYAAESAGRSSADSSGKTPDNSAGATRSKFTWGGAEFRQLEKDLSKTRTVPPPKDKGFAVRQMEALLKKRLPKEDIPGLIASISPAPDDEDKRSEFEACFLDVLAEMLIDSGDRENLVSLFSTQFSTHIGFGASERVLVCPAGHLKDPILVLGDAYGRAKNATIRTRIAAALHRGFDGNGIKGGDEAQFVKNSMQWYQDNKGELTLNDHFDRGPDADAEYVPLYVFKDGRQEQGFAELDARDQAIGAKPSRFAWNGPEIRQIKKEWASIKEPRPPKDGVTPRDVEFRFRQTKAILKKKLPKEGIPDLIRSLSALPVIEEKRSDFVKGFLEALAGTLIDSGDRADLVALFSTQFMSYIGFRPTEWVLVATSDKLKDPFLVLGEAYARAKDATVRTKIAGALHQGCDAAGVRSVPVFYGEPVNRRDEAQFVKNSMKWFEENKARLIVNTHYDPVGEESQFRPLYLVAPDKGRK